MTIKVLELTAGCFPKSYEKGDWFDLTVAEDITLRGPYSKALKRKSKGGEVVERYRDVISSSKLIPLGVAMQLPKGMEALGAARSSTFKKFGIIMTNAVGSIDNSYSGNED